MTRHNCESCSNGDHQGCARVGCHCYCNRGNIDTWQQLMKLPYGDPVLSEPKRTLFRRWCQENRGCRGSAEAMARLIGPSDICEIFDHIDALEERRMADEPNNPFDHDDDTPQAKDLWEQTVTRAIGDLYWATGGVGPDDPMVQALHDLQDAIERSGAHAGWYQAVTRPFE